MKRFICAALVLITLCTAFAAQAAFDPSASIGTKFVVLMDADSGAVLWSQRGDERAYPASTTKILTCILALENGNLDETITVGREVERGFSSKSSLMGLSPGETLTLRDLIY
ncbi:MAG TPA: D-alanyl-D-alanine carboxypeptidase, partial [Clostridia bacterium]|nr:D-alanyl-D-alanine carboxypeptidase [Clostridia bacterium]